MPGPRPRPDTTCSSNAFYLSVIGRQTTAGKAGDFASFISKYNAGKGGEGAGAGAETAEPVEPPRNGIRWIRDLFGRQQELKIGLDGAQR
jgi:hypothetical protein